MELPVLIVGAGPAGLCAALTLARQGITCRLIDKKPAATQTSNALGVHPRSLEMWDDLGLMPGAHAVGEQLTGTIFFDSQGQTLMQMQLADSVDTPYPYTYSIPQSDTEALLAERLKDFNVSVERSIDLVGLSQTDEGVSASVKTASGGTETIAAAYVLGCDGFHSATRDLLDVAYEGSDLPQTFMMCDAPLSVPFPSNNILLSPTKQGVVAVFPMKGSARTILDVTQDDPVQSGESPTQAHFIDALKKRWSFPHTLGEPHWMSHFTIHERLAARYRCGRIFLVGDAAHVHSPAGGQGMNTGMQDAYNIGWKLAGVIKGHLNPRYLDTYVSERRPVAQAVLSSSSTMTTLMSLRASPLIALRNFMLKHLASRRAFQNKQANQITGLSYHYRDSPLSKGSLLGLSAGDRMPWIVRGEKWVLFLSNVCKERAQIEALMRQHTAWARVEIGYERGYCFVRPDQYIGCLGEGLAGLSAYINHVQNPA